jgi:hypothetical protein
MYITNFQVGFCGHYFAIFDRSLVLSTSSLCFRMSLI